jgi:transposase
MGMARYVVDAVLLEGRSAREVARAHGISKTWIYELVKRDRAGGYEALEPRSRRPRSCRHETPREVVQAIVALRRELQAQGHDAGAETIAYHLSQDHEDIPSLSSIWRILRREGLVVAQHQKRPRCSLIRFEADLPNECWQADVTAWALASGEVVEILDLIDDHSRLHLGCDAYLRVKAADVVASFHKAAQLNGLPGCAETTQRSAASPSADATAVGA